MQTIQNDADRPAINLIESEADALSDIALTHSASSMGARLLLKELERAEVFDPGSLPPNVATMQSHVLFADEEAGVTRCVQLVYPGEADSAQGRVSVTTPIGAALIGMSAGETIEWPNRSGVNRRLRILQVTQPASPA